MAQNITLVYYYIPQDQDDPETPNAFGINCAKENLTHRDIKKAFPLEGKYIFRFKYKYQNQNIWMDLNSEDSKVPLYNNRIFMKATRLDFISNYLLSPLYQEENNVGDLTVPTSNLPLTKEYSQSARNLSLREEEEKQNKSQIITQPIQTQQTIKPIIQQSKNLENLMDF